MMRSTGLVTSVAGARMSWTVYRSVNVVPFGAVALSGRPLKKLVNVSGEAKVSLSAVMIANGEDVDVRMSTVICTDAETAVITTCVRSTPAWSANLPRMSLDMSSLKSETEPEMVNSVETTWLTI